MEWQNVYEERKTNAGAAIRRIAPGGRIVLAHAAGVPIALTDELVSGHRRARPAQRICSGPGYKNCRKRGAGRFHPLLFSRDSGSDC